MEENEWAIRVFELLVSSSEYAKTYYHYATDEMRSITHIVDDKNILNHYEYDACVKSQIFRDFSSCTRKSAFFIY